MGGERLSISSIRHLLNPMFPMLVSHNIHKGSVQPQRKVNCAITRRLPDDKRGSDRRNFEEIDAGETCRPNVQGTRAIRECADVKG
jgi:hypothetical protein